MKVMRKNDMIYIMIKQEELYQNQVNSSLVSVCNCKRDYSLLIVSQIKIVSCIDSPPVLFQDADGDGLPSTLHNMEKVSFAWTEKSEPGTVSVIATGAE